MATVVRPENLPHRPMVRSSTGEPLSLSADVAAAVGLRRGFAHHEVLPPGRRASAPHRHTKKEELVYVLSGRPSLWVNGETRPLTPGDVVGFPAGEEVLHAMVNDSAEDATILIVAAGREGDEVVY